MAFCCLQDGLRLLCPAGGCAPINQPDACNLGKVSAHAVVGTAAFKSSPAGAAAIQQLVAAGRPAGMWQLAMAKLCHIAALHNQTVRVSVIHVLNSNVDEFIIQ
jgi:hypothetical protein